MAICKQPNLDIFSTELGWMVIAGTGQSVWGMAFGYKTPREAQNAVRDYFDAEPVQSEWLPELRQRLIDFAAGRPDDFLDVKVTLPQMAPFATAVIERCRRIPYGQTLSYSQLAADAGSPRAARAVGNIMRANRCPLIVPCHRVVHADGTIGHYNAAEGARMKQRLLAMEHASSGLPAAPPRPIRTPGLKRRLQLV